jgi:O-antigen ligase
LALAAVAVIVSLFLASTDAGSVYIQRQATSSSSLSEDGFSGRTSTWLIHVDYLTDRPALLLTGIGLGYSYQVIGEIAHNLFLHIWVELGLFGLIGFLLFHLRLLRSLSQAKARTMYWTVIALLLTGMAQETLYPIVFLTHFLAFYASALVIVLRIGYVRTLAIPEGPA